MKKLFLSKPSRVVVLLALLFLFSFFNIQYFWAYNKVRLVINDGITDGALRERIENTVSLVLSEINQAQEEKQVELSLPERMVQPQALEELNMLWKNEHFRCVEEEIVEHLITTRDGYQVRRIPLVVSPMNEGGGLGYQEAVINFDKQGLITSFYYTINPDIYSGAMEGVLKNKRNEVTEIEERMMILNYVEHFRTAYNQKDLKFLNQVFSNEALIITGTVIRTRRSDMNPTGVSIKYIQKSKKEYLDNMDRIFKRNNYIKVNFDNVTIVKHPTLENFYGVTVHQKWRTSNYSDEGYVFMVWDFRNPDEPQIHVRTWQPEYVDKAHGQKLSPNDVFNLGDFDL